MELADLAEVQKVVEQGAVLRASLLDGFETIPGPVFWLHYHNGLLRYGRPGPSETIHDYQIDSVASLGEEIIFHTSGDTSVAALILAPTQQAAVLLVLHEWRRVVGDTDRYPEQGWRFGGRTPPRAWLI